MFWKSISATLPPQVGSGFLSKCSRALSRKASIHSGSFFIAEISRTTSWSRPRRDLKTGAMSSWKPNFSLYPSRISSVSVFSFMVAPYLRALGRLGVAHPVVPLRFQLVRQLRSARLDDAAVDEHVDEVGLDVIQYPLIVRDQQHAKLGTGEGVHPFRHDAERVDVQAGIGLVQHRDLGFEHRHLEDLGALLLAAREAVVDVAPRERVVHLEQRHLLLHEGAEFLGRKRLLQSQLLPAGLQRHAQEVGDAHARDSGRIL